MIKRYFTIIILVHLLSCCSEIKTKQVAEVPNSAKSDSIRIWIDESKNPESTELQKLSVLNKAYQFALNSPSDSLKAQYFSTLSQNLYKTGDSTLFRKVNNLAISLNK